MMDRWKRRPLPAVLSMMDRQNSDPGTELTPPVSPRFLRPIGMKIDPPVSQRFLRPEGMEFNPPVSMSFLRPTGIEKAPASPRFFRSNDGDHFMSLPNKPSMPSYFSSADKHEPTSIVPDGFKRTRDERTKLSLVSLSSKPPLPPTVLRSTDTSAVVPDGLNRFQVERKKLPSDNIRSKPPLPPNVLRSTDRDKSLPDGKYGTQVERTNLSSDGLSSKPPLPPTVLRSNDREKPDGPIRAKIEMTRKSSSKDTLKKQKRRPLPVSISNLNSNDLHQLLNKSSSDDMDNTGHSDTSSGHLDSSSGLWESHLGLSVSPAGLVDSPAALRDSHLGLVDTPAGLSVSPAGLIGSSAELSDLPTRLKDPPTGHIDTGTMDRQSRQPTSVFRKLPVSFSNQNSKDHPQLLNKSLPDDINRAGLSESPSGLTESPFGTISRQSRQPTSVFGKLPVSFSNLNNEDLPQLLCKSLSDGINKTGLSGSPSGVAESPSGTINRQSRQPASVFRKLNKKFQLRRLKSLPEGINKVTMLVESIDRVDLVESSVDVGMENIDIPESSVDLQVENIDKVGRPESSVDLQVQNIDKVDLPESSVDEQVPDIDKLDLPESSVDEQEETILTADHKTKEDHSRQPTSGFRKLNKEDKLKHLRSLPEGIDKLNFQHSSMDSQVENTVSTNHKTKEAISRRSSSVFQKLNKRFQLRRLKSLPEGIDKLNLTKSSMDVQLVPPDQKTREDLLRHYKSEGLVEVKLSNSSPADEDQPDPSLKFERNKIADVKVKKALLRPYSSDGKVEVKLLKSSPTVEGKSVDSSLTRDEFLRRSDGLVEVKLVNRSPIIEEKHNPSFEFDRNIAVDEKTNLRPYSSEIVEVELLKTSTVEDKPVHPDDAYPSLGDTKTGRIDTFRDDKEFSSSNSNPTSEMLANERMSQYDAENESEYMKVHFHPDMMESGDSYPSLGDKTEHVDKEFISSKLNTTGMQAELGLSQFDTENEPEYVNVLPDTPESRNPYASVGEKTLHVDTYDDKDFASTIANSVSGTTNELKLSLSNIKKDPEYVLLDTHEPCNEYASLRNPKSFRPDSSYNDKDLTSSFSNPMSGILDDLSLLHPHTKNEPEYVKIVPDTSADWQNIIDHIDTIQRKPGYIRASVSSESDASLEAMSIEGKKAGYVTASVGSESDAGLEAISMERSESGYVRASMCSDSDAGCDAMSMKNDKNYFDPYFLQNMMDSDTKDAEILKKENSGLNGVEGRETKMAVGHGHCKKEAYYRQGVALQCLGRHADALAAFSSGLSQDPKSLQLLAGLVEAAIKSPLRGTFEPIYKQLQLMKLDKSPFVIISVIGQELLAAGYHASSLTVLESALTIGTCSLKLRGSVFSALSSAHWGLGNAEKATEYMLQDLSVSKSLNDHVGECRAHGNLGAAYFSQGNYKEALSHHRFQLVLAMKQKDRNVAASALSSLGHVYSAIGDYPNALASHRQCVLLAKQLTDKQFEAREVGNVGAVYLALGDFENALDCHKQHLNIAKQLENRNEEARAYSNLGSAYHYKRDFDKARVFHNHVLNIASELGDRTVEARAFAGLGHAARCKGDLDNAKHCHEQQLNIALSTKDKVMEGRACSNLGIICQQLRQYDSALKLHKAHLTIASDIADRAGMGRAFGNIGNAHSALGQPEQAVKYHKQELTISREVNDRSSEACTHGNLAVAYQAMNMQEKAQEHYQSHINIAKELKDSASEARALLNLGNYHCSRGEFTQALPFYLQFLTLSKQVNDNTGLGKAYHNLGYAHYSLGNFKEAVHFYERDLALAKDQKDKVNMGRAFCNLGLAYRALGNFTQAEECQKCFLTIAHHVKNAPGKFRALGNLGDIYMAKQDTDGAIKLYEHQLRLAKQVNNKALEASAYGALGAANRKIRLFDKALAYHTQELHLCEELSDIKGECKAHSNLGAVHTSLSNFMDAIKCYEEQLKRASELQDSAQQAQAYGNLGISKMNMNLFEDALGYFEEQLATLEQGVGNCVLNDKGRAFGNMAECYEALGDFDEAVRNFEQYLLISQKMNNSSEQDKAYRGLGNMHRAMGNLQQALFCFEKRLVVAHETGNATTRASAYGELGCLHSLMGNYEQAISCLEHQLEVAREMSDKVTQGDAACGLGGVYREMGEHEKALEYHQLDLTLAEETNNLSYQGRAFGNLGVTNELLGNYQKAIMYQEQHLSIAAQVNDRVAKALAYSSLGRIHHALGNYAQAVAYLRQGLQIADQLGRKEDEAKIRHRLGLALWSNGDLDEAQQQLYQAADIFENIRRETQTSNEYNLSLLESQSTSYQALQKVLVAMGRSDEALAVAERARTRAFVDLLLERQAAEMNSVDVMDTVLMSVDQILGIVARQKATVLYFSIAAGHLYSWLINAEQGIVKFNDCNLNDLEKDSAPADQTNNSQADNSSNAMMNLCNTTHLDHYIMHARESLGVDSQQQWVRGQGDITSETESEADELLQQHLDELSSKLAHDPDKSGFMRMGNRNHQLNSSSRSVASVISQLSSAMNLNGSSVKNQSQKLKLSWSGRPPLRVLYDLLIAPMEDALPKRDGLRSVLPDLVLVLEGDLYLVPFAVLKGGSSIECLHERFNLRILPSLKALTANLYWEKRSLSNSGLVPALVVANPKMPQAVTDRWGWGDLPNAEQEAHIIADLMGVKPLTNQSATKEKVFKSISTAECLHFATLVSWKLSALILSPGEVTPGSPQHRYGDNNGNMECHDINYNDDNKDSSPDIPALSQFLLTAADVLDLRLTAKLVVLSAYSTDSRGGRITADSVIGLARAFLAAGAQSVLVPLWPVAEPSNKIFMKTLYNTLLQGSKASVAIGEAMQSVRDNKQFGHPSNWAGYMLLGCDVRLSNKSAMFGNALGDLLTTPTRCREALRVLLHLIEKSLQRINRSQNNPMYTTQQSIMNKVGPVRGWRELLKAVGFRFEEDNTGGNIPPSVFFPTSDPGDRLLQASASLQALLGLSPNTLIALSKLLSSPEAATEITSMLDKVKDQISASRGRHSKPDDSISVHIDSHFKSPRTQVTKMLQQVVATYTRDREGAIQLPVNVDLWRTPGCHELLASLGFDLIDVGKEEVLLITGKNVSRRMITYALQGLMAVFDPSEAPKHLPALESFSSMESLCSDHSGNSVSGMSGMSLSAMSGASIVSSHSLKSGKSVASNRPTEPSMRGANDGPRAKLRAKSHFGTSTPVTKDSNKVVYETVNPYGSFGADMSPVNANTSQNKPDLSTLSSSQVNSSTPPKPGDDDEYSIESTLAMGPDVTTLLNRLNRQFGDFDTPTPTNSEGTISLPGHYSSREQLIGGEDSSFHDSVGNVNYAFEDDMSDFDHTSMRGFGPVRITNRKSPSVGSDSSNDVFHPTFPRQSPVKLEPGVTNPGFSRGSSPGYSRGSSTSPGNSRGSSPHVKDPRRLNRISPALSQHSSRDSPRARGESPHEVIAMKILHDTLGHMNAVETMQRRAKLEQTQQKKTNGPLKSDPSHSAFVHNFPKHGEHPQQDKNYGAFKLVSTTHRRFSESSTISNGELADSGDHGVVSEQGATSTARANAVEIKAPPPIKAKPMKSIYQDKLNTGQNRNANNASGNVNITSSNDTLTEADKSVGDIPSIIRPQAPRGMVSMSNMATPSTSNTATLPMRKKINYMPPPDYQNMNHSHNNSSFDSTDSSSHRPDSVQSAVSSMYGSTSSIPSVIHMPIGGTLANGGAGGKRQADNVDIGGALANGGTGSKRQAEPIPIGGALANRGLGNKRQAEPSVDRSSGTFPSSLRRHQAQLNQLKNNSDNLNSSQSETVSIDSNSNANQRLETLASGSNPARSNETLNGDVRTEPNANSQHGTSNTEATKNSSNLRVIVPKPFANGGVGWSSVNGPKSPKSPGGPTSPQSPLSPGSKTVTVRRVYSSSAC